MKIAIIFATKHGTTKKVAKLLANRFLGDTVSLISLNRASHPDLSSFDWIILGTAIYGGKSMNKMVRFCHNYRKELTGKKIACFICCMHKAEEERKKQLSQAFPLFITGRATAMAILGGEFQFEKMFLLNRLVIKSITGYKHSISHIDYENIDRFSTRIKAS